MHAPISQPRLFTFTDEHATGSNHIADNIHNVINDVLNIYPLPIMLLLQMDNCIGENKNKYLMSYLDCLVQRSVFYIVEVGFLPVVHIHTEIE